ncbi:MAG: hypothetical protein U9R75_07840 [Candidatus Thermoplasmatota archaeon]|nr:hypothetical protein [Candidatus Thermoplasmatota archaeon]
MGRFRCNRSYLHGIGFILIELVFMVIYLTVSVFLRSGRRLYSCRRTWTNTSISLGSHRNPKNGGSSYLPSDQPILTLKSTDVEPL